MYVRSFSTTIISLSRRVVDYDLVRYHHPDSPHCRSLEPAERHARFQAITHAYDVLRGKSSGFPERDPYREEVRRRKQHYEAHRARRAPFVHPEKEEWTPSADDRWKDRVILVVSILVGQPFNSRGHFTWMLHHRHLWRALLPVYSCFHISMIGSICRR